MTNEPALPKLELAHALLSEAEALSFLGGHRIRMGARTMDPKAQLVGEFVKSIRVPGYFPPLPELRQQLRTMVTLMDEPAPALARIEEIKIPGPAGSIPARVYDAASGGGARPALAYFHGGGWVQGDLETHHGLCARLAQRAGVIVVAVDYRLAPEHKFPAAVDDCLAAYRWLRERGREVGVDTGRVGVGGDSAGGNLSAVVCQLARAQGLPRPACQVLIYPATDFTLETPSHRELEHGHIIPRDRILWYAQQYLRNEADKLDERASPIRGDLRGLPPALIITAGFDPLRDEGHRYAQALRAGGTEVQYHEYEGQIHAFVSLTRAIPQGMTATLEIADYLRARL
ncbi:MAG TPA: alpha/beta hydrolase [Methylomirabilota bacterium]|nr:alpha/beta hydrolase [Methylomirabilota bacterium]